MASCVPLALSLAVAAPGDAHADPEGQRCAADALTPALARQRLEWARDCGVRMNVRSPSSPLPPAFSYDTGIIASDGVTHLIEYIETDDFWGTNSYSGVNASVNGAFTSSQWQAGPFSATTDASGFQKWTEASSYALAQPTYPTFGTSTDIASGTPLFVNPNYALRDCGFYLNSTATVPASTSATGFFVNAYCRAASVITGRCADGSQEQVFAGGMVGCAGAVSFADRGTLCAPGFRTATAAEWVALRGGAAPVHDYWTNDGLKYSGAGTSACAVSTEAGFSCGATPMRVCTATGGDPEGNVCNWQHCGLEANAPDQFFGGCAGNTTAGALCIVSGCADGTIEQTFAGGMVGCAAAETYANRASVCAPGYRVATATEWVALGGGVAPSHDYWTSDALKYSGAGSSACFVSTTVGTDCGATPMRVCTPGGTDAEGNLCNWTHCGIDANAPDQFFGGCVLNPTAGALCVPSTGCADGSVEQVFEKGMVGCAGAVTYANRDALCAPGYQPATAAQWVANRGNSVPAHDYWTNDALNWSGSGPSACAVSPVNGATTCGVNPMRVCTNTGVDPENNTCNWTHCGLEANAPDQWFGGCVGATAGTLCTPVQDAAVIAQNTTVTLSPRFAIGEVHAAHGANTSGSLAAAVAMAARGYDNRSLQGNWESALVAGCTAQSGSTLWPASCRPTGMAAAITGLTSGKWEARSWPATDQAGALGELAAAFQFYLSPVALPIFGQADHWVTVTQLVGVLNASTWTINTVKFFDAGPAGAFDRGGNSYVAGLVTVSGSVWKAIYGTPVATINSVCDANGCTSDPYYNHYTMVFDPPPGPSHPAVAAEFVRAPGIAQAGAGPTARAAMTAPEAQARVWDALAAAGIPADPGTWEAIRGGVAGEPLEVHAVQPSGEPWDYYLVPVFARSEASARPATHDGRRGAIAFVQLAARDGSFEAIEVLAAPHRFAPIPGARAAQLARGSLAPGERLAGATLTWDPRPDPGAAPARPRIARSPIQPYYELAIERSAAPGTPVGRVRVALDGLSATRLGPARPR